MLYYHIIWDITILLFYVIKLLYSIEPPSLFFFWRLWTTIFHTENLAILPINNPYKICMLMVKMRENYKLIYINKSYIYFQDRDARNIPGISSVAPGNFTRPRLYRRGEKKTKYDVDLIVRCQATRGTFWIYLLMVRARDRLRLISANCVPLFFSRSISSPFFRRAG